MECNAISCTLIARVAWPSGLRRWFKAPVSSGAWVRIPPLPTFVYVIQVGSSCILSSPELLTPIKQACAIEGSQSISPMLFLSGEPQLSAHWQPANKDLVKKILQSTNLPGLAAVGLGLSESLSAIFEELF